MTEQGVYVHLWDGFNCNLYDSHNAALYGIAFGYEDEADVEAALYEAVESGGDPAFLYDDSVIRYLTIQTAREVSSGE